MTGNKDVSQGRRAARVRTTIGGQAARGQAAGRPPANGQATDPPKRGRIPRPGPLQPIPGPSDEELDALWARLLTELGFPPRCPRGACRRSRACRPANGVFACRVAHPEAFERVKLGLVRGQITVAKREP